ncbi:hypothetical protein CS006_05585 [Bifidobacterium primatium]|uniref:Uncharacterized protein n=1 Tax=Bifidobacterium primatium TaxID=2045438 RepID=A0A2M9H9L2_9BIFI|nr:hypothetical protein [Bifidobacterium primatium]PJM73503.1 hypothetical protein CS006_05585 [Bifidobacterium primatium]
MSDETNLTDKTAHTETTDGTASGSEGTKGRGLFHKPPRVGEETVWQLMYRAIYQSLLFIGVFAVVSAIAGYMFSGLHGIWSAVMALVAVILFCLSNPVLVSVLSRLHLRPAAYLTWFLLGWMIKVGIVVAVLLGIKDAQWLDPKLCAVFLLIGAAIVLAAEIHTAATSRVPYVDPPKRDRFED